MNQGNRNQVKAGVLSAVLLLLAAVLSGCGNQEPVDGAAEISRNQAENVFESIPGSDESEEVSPTPLNDQTAPAEEETGESEEVSPAPSNSPAAPTEEELNDFLKTHYAELEHDMALVMGEVSDITPFQILSGVQWKSQNENTAIVKEGKIYALQPGETLFTARVGEYELFCNLVVNGYEDMMLALNGSKTLPEDAFEGGLRLETDSSDIVSVERNSLTARAPGRSTLTASIGEAQYSFQVVVTEPQLSADSLSKIVGTTEQLSVYGTPSEIIWKSDNEAIATVDQNGLVTAAPGGIGQSTFIRAQVDGTELSCQVSVEAIPQLSTSYRIYGYSAGADENGTPVENTIALYANANETIDFTTGAHPRQAVMSMSSVKFTNNIYPVYYAYGNEAVGQADLLDGRCAHTQIYLLGTSEMAHVMVKNKDDGEVSGSTTATYTPQEGFGIIDVYIETPLIEMHGDVHIDPDGDERISMYIEGDSDPSPYNYQTVKLEEGEPFQYISGSSSNLSGRDFKIISLNIGEPESYEVYGETGIKKEFTGTVLMKDSEQSAVRVYVEVSGLTYQMYVDTWDLGLYTPSVPVSSRFFIDDDNMSADQYVTEMAQGAGQVQQAGSNSSFRNASDSFVPGEWFEKMKGKFVEEAENQAVKMAVGFLFKLIFL